MNVYSTESPCVQNTPPDGLIDRSLGTPAFHAPETCRDGQPYLGTAYDAWCLGVVLHLLLFAALPIWDPSAADMYEKLRDFTQLPASAGDTQVQGAEGDAWPDDLLQCVRGLLVGDPMQRWTLARARETLSAALTAA